MSVVLQGVCTQATCALTPCDSVTPLHSHTKPPGPLAGQLAARVCVTMHNDRWRRRPVAECLRQAPPSLVTIFTAWIQPMRLKKERGCWFVRVEDMMFLTNIKWRPL